jgi:hypothetical protein
MRNMGFRSQDWVMVNITQRLPLLSLIGSGEPGYYMCKWDGSDRLLIKPANQESVYPHVIVEFDGDTPTQYHYSESGRGDRIGSQEINPLIALAAQIAANS